VTTRNLEGRRFALLQGPSSRFFAHLGRALKERGAEVARIGFCPGDRLFWNAAAGDYLPYRGTDEDFPGWLHTFAAGRATTDMVMLGDGRAFHRAALEAVAGWNMPIRTWIVEHGYLRPNLILIEPDGMGGGSTIPLRPLPENNATPEAAPRWTSSFAAYAAMDIAYHASNVLLSRITYPHYRPHSGIHPIHEYSGWIGKIARSRQRSRERERALAAIAQHHGPLFLFPLQLSQDFQLSRYGTGETQDRTLSRVVTSFLAHAPGGARLVVKVHPLDNARTDWQVRIAEHAPRVLYLDGGDLDALLARTSGVVTINSTVGLTALQAGVPTLALGDAIYKAAGLTDTGPLDSFWQGPQRPPQERVAAFCSYIRENFHVPGAFDGPGAPIGAANLADWLGNPPEVLRSDAA
jgi:capsular polysaccharide export protein